MRQFAIRNEWGDQRSLTNKNGLFLITPDGLGAGSNGEYSRITDGFFAATPKRPAQTEITGIIIASKNAYRIYHDFVRWLMQSDDLQLMYRPSTDIGWYYIDVDVRMIEKGELTRAGVLEAPISFAAKSPWYDMQPLTFAIPVDVPAKADITYTRYPFVYGSVYPVSWSNNINSVDITVGGHLPAGIYMEYRGALTSPAITLTQGKTEIGCMSLNTTITESETLIFSTRPNASGVWIMDADGDIRDVYDKVDITRNAYFRVLPNTTYTLMLTSSSAITTPATVNIYQYYRSV